MLHMGLPTIGPAIRDTYDLSLAEVGLLFTMVAGGAAVGLMPWGYMSDVIGERAVFTCGSALLSATLCVLAFSSGFVVLLIGVAIAGAMGSSNAGAGARTVIGWFSPRERGTALGIRQMASPAGGALASLTLPIAVTVGGVRAAFLLLAGVALAASRTAAIWLRDPPKAKAAAGSKPKASPDARQRRLGLCVALMGVAQSIAMGFLVLFLHDERGLSVGAAAACLGVVQVLGAGGRIGLGWLSDRRGARVRLLRTAALLQTIVFVSLAALTQAWGVVLYPLLIVAAVLSLAWSPLAVAASAELAGPTRVGVATGFITTCLAVGAIVAPVGFGALVEQSSWRIGYAATAIPLLVAALMLRALEREEAQRADGESAPLELSPELEASLETLA
jgi:sugar phosphate permease